MSVSRRNNVHVLGTGDRVLLFAHGYGCDQSMWRHVYPSFLESFKIVLFDYVGSGSSDTSAFDPTRYSTLNGYASDVLEILHEVKAERVNFVGHSVSSMIGALAANREPGLFESLVMIGPSPSYINDGEYIGGFSGEDIDGLLSSLESNHMAWSATMAPVIMGHPDTPELAGELEQSFCRMDPMLAHHFARVTFLSDNRADLPQIKTRTLILQCAKDMIAPASVGEYVHQCIRGSQYTIMDATGHCPHMSAPKEVIRQMQAFLERK
jgi:sigma-B regulation protein RsbQ